MRLIGGFASLVSYCLRLAKFPEEAFLICLNQNHLGSVADKEVGGLRKTPEKGRIKQLLAADDAAAAEEISAETVLSELDGSSSVKVTTKHAEVFAQQTTLNFCLLLAS